MPYIYELIIVAWYPIKSLKLKQNLRIIRIKIN